MNKNFPSHMFPKLGFYVYGLLDPRTNEPFYIGKGKENRVLSHIKGIALNKEEASSLKLKTIQTLKSQGLNPKGVIYRHGLSEAEAFLIEAVLIDLYKQKGLTNLVAGHGSDEFGITEMNDLITRYNREPLLLEKNIKVMAVKIPRKIQELSLYEATRCAWKCDLSRARRADFVFSLDQDVCVGVFIVNQWLPALKNNFPLLSQDNPQRWGFEGVEAPSEVCIQYVGKIITHETFGKNIKSQTSILYNYD